MTLSDLSRIAAHVVRAANDCDGPEHYGAVNLELRARFGGHVVLWSARIGRWAADSVEGPAEALETLHAEIIGGQS